MNKHKKKNRDGEGGWERNFRFLGGKLCHQLSLSTGHCTIIALQLPQVVFFGLLAHSIPLALPLSLSPTLPLLVHTHNDCAPKTPTQNLWLCTMQQKEIITQEKVQTFVKAWLRYKNTDAHLYTHQHSYSYIRRIGTLLWVGKTNLRLMEHIKINNNTNNRRNAICHLDKLIAYTQCERNSSLFNAHSLHTKEKREKRSGK